LRNSTTQRDVTVRQVLAAIDRLTEGTEHRGTEGDHA